MILGQLFFRDAGQAPTNDGRKLMMVVGLVAVPADFDALKGECQYMTTGSGKVDEGLIFLAVHHGTKVDFEDRMHGYDIGSVLLEPIWRC